MRQVWIDIRVRLSALLRRNQLRERAVEEAEIHMAMRAERLIESGLLPDQAHAQARREFGNALRLQEETLDSWRYTAVDNLMQDIRYASRMLRRAPGFTAIAVFSLALGIGANTALFSLVDALLLRDLPVRDPGTLVSIRRIASSNGPAKPTAAMTARMEREGFDRPTFDALKELKSVFDDVAGFSDFSPFPEIAINGSVEPVRPVVRVTGNFFRMIGISAALGRLEADAPGAIISHRMWQGRFQGKTDVLGQALTMNDRAYTIVGVAPEGFLGLSLNTHMDVWVVSPDSNVAPPTVIGRLQPGVTVEQAQAAVASLFQQMDSQGRSKLPGSKHGLAILAEVNPAGKGFTNLREQYRTPLLALMALVILVLLITCMNIGNLLIAKNASRVPELTVRTAMGALRSRLVMQLLAESVVLALVGGALAMFVARAGVAAILSMLPISEIPEQLSLHLDARLLSFMAAISLASAILFSLAPAWRATRVDLATGLKSAARSTAGGDRRRLGQVLVGAQIALSMVLLTGAGLFLRTLQNTTSIDPGFVARNLLQVQIDSRAGGFGPRGGRPVRQLYAMLLERLAAVPGVESVTTSRNPLVGNAMAVFMGEDYIVNLADVSPGFFETMRIPVVRGRVFTAGDLQTEGLDPVVVSEAYAKQFFPGEDPVGKPARTEAGVIVGVVKDAKLGGIRAEDRATLYGLALRREPDRLAALEIRTTGDPAAIASRIQRTVEQIHPRLFVSARTMEDTINRSIARERLVAALSAFLGLLGLVLAGIGLFGVASFAVAQRTSELGIRIALGAGRWGVIRESLRGTALVVGIGLAAGGAAAFAGARMAAAKLEGLLFGLTATDGVNIAAAAALMIGVAIAACITPAVRAIRVDPLRAIRCE